MTDEVKRNDAGAAGADFPTAETRSSRAAHARKISWMWLVTVACVMLAIAVTWYSTEAAGPEITIQFPEGHGLKTGDAVQHRGIEVGRVTDVELNKDLSGIVVEVRLDAAATAIATEGSRFWVVRPKIGLTGISGLETAVGSKYIAVLPGPPGQAKKNEFEGLPQQPSEASVDAGIEIVLRSEDRHGINPGSPVLWRGVEVGQVLGSTLSPDALHVDTRVRIVERHRRLLARESKFWVVSGVDMKFGVTGFDVSAATLDTITRGGIAFITSGPRVDDRQVQAGDLFTLHAKVNETWLASARPLGLLEGEPPPTVTMVATWSTRSFGITRGRQVTAVGLAIAASGGPVIVMPGDLVPPAEAIQPDSYELRCHDHSISLELDEFDRRDAGKLAVVPLDAGVEIPGRLLDRDRFRAPESPEDCLAVRQLRQADGEPAFLIEAIGRHELMPGDTRWTADVERLGRDGWHGAAVVSAADEKIIGMLIIDSEGTSVVPIDL